MKKFLVLTGLVFTTATNLWAQDVVAYFVKGDVNVVIGDKTESLKKNSTIPAAAKLVFGHGGVAILLMDEKAAVLDETGTFSYDDLVKEIKRANTSLSSKYVSYIWNSAQKKKSDERMEVTEMVSRGRNTILYPSQDSSIVITPSFDIQVERESVPGTLFFYEKKHTRFALSINDTIVTLYNKGLLEEREWFGLATSFDDNAPSIGIIYIRWASDSESQSVKQELQKLLVEIAEMPQEVQDEIISAYFDSHHYVSNQTF